MQEDDKSQEWQQQPPAVSSVPVEPVAPDVPAPMPEVGPPVAAEPSVEALAPDNAAVTEVPDQETMSDESAPPEETQDLEGQAVSDEPVDEADESLIKWQATEYLQHDRSAKWYIILAVVTLGLIAAAVFLMNSISFAILLPVMAAALVIYVRRPPGVIDYTVSRKGIHINDRLYTYDDFRSFGVLSHDGAHSVILAPRKRFQLSQTMYFPEEVGESLVDMLAARLPMKDVKPDAIDSFLARLRL